MYDYFWDKWQKEKDKWMLQGIMSFSGFCTHWLERARDLIESSDA
jgi:hypothetical protein